MHLAHGRIAKASIFKHVMIPVFPLEHVKLLLTIYDFTCTNIGLLILTDDKLYFRRDLDENSALFMGYIYIYLILGNLSVSCSDTHTQVFFPEYKPLTLCLCPYHHHHYNYCCCCCYYH